ncbi:DUF4097 family beta strand repeat-containing protein [Nocardia sp. NPDC050793]|uniref:DUF4097 family beta strand repeat-containing protein n=1 Tax=Nocardia sp. NPDC050793 TaxID=3155159 RepID=UPI003409B685
MPKFETPEPISVTIELSVGDTRIVAGDRVDTIVEVHPSNEANESDVKAAELTRVEYSNGRLRVKAPKQFRWKPYGPAGNHGSVDVVIELPAGSDVRGDTAMGTFRTVGRLGECRFKTALGDIELDHSAELQLTNAMGVIAVERAVGKVEITMGSGEVRLREVDGPAEIKHSNGDTVIGSVTGDLRLKSANGSITVGKAGSGVDVRTANGDVRIGEITRGSVALACALGDLEVGVRKGTAVLLDLRTKFGSVRNALDNVENPEPSDETAELRARSGRGDITVRRSATAGSQ